jgi:hypothetical protein
MAYYRNKSRIKSKGIQRPIARARNTFAAIGVRWSRKTHWYTMSSRSNERRLPLLFRTAYRAGHRSLKSPVCSCSRSRCPRHRKRGRRRHMGGPEKSRLPSRYSCPESPAPGSWPPSLCKSDGSRPELGDGKLPGGRLQRGDGISQFH